METPKKEWQGLTESEIHKIERDAWIMNGGIIRKFDVTQCIRMVEKLLKEKNRE